MAQRHKGKVVLMSCGPAVPLDLLPHSAHCILNATGIQLFFIFIKDF